MENNEYNEMSVYELKALQQEMTAQFNEYKKVLADVYGEMGKLSEEYERINDIIKERNGQ